MTPQAQANEVFVPANAMAGITVTGRERVHLSGQVHTGSFSIIEFSAEPGTEPATEMNETEDRFFCLLEGEWEVRVGGDRFCVKAGGSFHAPRGVSYDYRILSPTGRAVVLVTRPNQSEHKH